MTSQYKGSKVGFPIRKFLDQSSFAAPQDLSQRTTSFIASQRQGIHQMLLRHLITLMIDVRSAKAGHDLKKDLSSTFRSKTYFCLPSISGARRLRAVSWFAKTRLLHLPNMLPLYDFKHPRHPPHRAGREPHLTFRKKILVEPVGIEPTT